MTLQAVVAMVALREHSGLYVDLVVQPLVFGEWKMIESGGDAPVACMMKPVARQAA